MSFGPVLQIQVGLDFGRGAEPLGKLALRDRKIYFEYEADFITRNLNVSPFRLPLKSGVQTFDNRLFEGLPDLFDDSLPDGWGRLLFARTLRAQGLLHSDFRTPSIDYQDFIELTTVMTRDVREVTKMFRLAAFNVLAHNRDDHSKNCSFLMDESGDWRLSPAYDLTLSSGPGGEQSTVLMGEGKAPHMQQLRSLGEVADLSKKAVAHILDGTQRVGRLAKTGERVRRSKG